MKIRLGVISEEHNINILQEVIEEYNDYEITAFIDPDGTHTLNIIEKVRPPMYQPRHHHQGVPKYNPELLF